MTTFRDDLQPCVDEANQILADLCLREHVVVIQTRTWVSGTPGRGPVGLVDVTITPKPKVENPEKRLRFANAGRYKDGDRVISAITRTLSEDDLTGGDTPDGIEIWWLIDNEPYRLVEIVERASFEWIVLVRRINRK